jgi:hypothetical protein
VPWLGGANFMRRGSRSTPWKAEIYPREYSIITSKLRANKPEYTGGRLQFLSAKLAIKNIANSSIEQAS